MRQGASRHKNNVIANVQDHGARETNSLSSSSSRCAAASSPIGSTACSFAVMWKFWARADEDLTTFFLSLQALHGGLDRHAIDEPVDMSRLKEAEELCTQFDVVDLLS